MSGRLLGYVRIGSMGRMIDRVKLSQLAELTLHEVFLERADSKDSDRRQLKRLLAVARDGDTVVCQAMDRMGLNTEHLTSVIEDLTRKGVSVEFLEERLIFQPGDPIRTSVILSAMQAVARFEENLGAERSREAALRVVKRNYYRPEKTGVKARLTDGQIANMRRDASAGLTNVALAALYGVDRKTVIRHLRGAAGGAVRNHDGRPPALSEAQVLELRNDAAKGLTKVHLAEKYNISRQSVFRYLRDEGAGN